MARAIGICLCLTLLTLGSAPSGQAATIDGVTLPDMYPVGRQSLVLNGLGIRRVTILQVRAYVAGLYLPQRTHDATAILNSTGPKVLLLQFLHAASKAQIEAHYREGEERNCGHDQCDRADQADFERLVAATPAMAVGDTLTYVFDGGAVRALANNREIGAFRNPDLARHLLDGFIGATPPSPDLKARLLGLAPG